MKINYKGALGEFTYDDTEFTVTKYKGQLILKYLSAVGITSYSAEKIKIPNGLNSCKYMFANSTIVYSPKKIPNSVVNCDYMFYECRQLQTIPIIPNSVISARHMFAGCKDLKNIGSLPPNITNAEGMFERCYRLRFIENLPKNLEIASSMFSNCTVLMDSCFNETLLPKTLKNSSYMFSNCDCIHTFLRLHNGIENCEHMYKGCRILKSYTNIIPKTCLNGVYVVSRELIIQNLTEMVRHHKSLEGNFKEIYVEEKMMYV